MHTSEVLVLNISIFYYIELALHYILEANVTLNANFNFQFDCCITTRDVHI